MAEIRALTPEPDEGTVVISVDGRSYSLRVGDLSAVDAQALRRATGMSLRSVMQSAEDDPDIDVIAALVWLARRAAGERALSFEVVAASITYNSDFGAADVVAEDTSDPSS